MESTILLQNNKLVTVSLKEDNNQECKAIMYLADLYKKPYHEKAVKDQICRLVWIDQSRNFSENPKHYIFKVTQSCWSDNSGIGDGYGVYLTKGEAISKMIDAGFHVFNGSEIEITK